MRLRPIHVAAAIFAGLLLLGLLLRPSPAPRVEVEAARAAWASRFSYYVPEVEATVRAGEFVALRAVFIENGVEVADALALVEASDRPQRVALAATQGRPDPAAGWGFELLARRPNAETWTTIARGDVEP